MIKPCSKTFIYRFYGAKIGVRFERRGKIVALRIIAGQDKDFNGEVVFKELSIGLWAGTEVGRVKTVKEIVEEAVQKRSIF